MIDISLAPELPLLAVMTGINHKAQGEAPSKSQPANRRPSILTVLKVRLRGASLGNLEREGPGNNPSCTSILPGSSVFFRGKNSGENTKSARRIA
jgi:hypothetical protein